MILWSKNLKPVRSVHWNRVFFGAGLYQKNSCFNEYHHRFSNFYLQSNTRLPSFFGPSYNVYRQQKIKWNMSSFLMKSFISDWKTIFTHEYHQTSVISVTRFSLEKMLKLFEVSKKLFKIKKLRCTDEKNVHLTQFFHQCSFLFIILDRFFETIVMVPKKMFKIKNTTISW